MTHALALADLGNDVNEFSLSEAAAADGSLGSFSGTESKVRGTVTEVDATEFACPPPIGGSERGLPY